MFLRSAFVVIFATLSAWSIASAKLPRPFLTLKSEKHRVVSVALSRDGKLVASGRANGLVCVWEVATGKELYSLNEKPGAPASICFSRDGKTLIASSDEKLGLDRFRGTLTWWDLGKRKRIRQLRYSWLAGDILLSPDGKLITTGTGKERDNAINLLDAATGKLVRRIRTNPCLDAVVFSPDSKRLALADNAQRGGRITIWDLTANKEVLGFNRDQTISALAYSPDGKRLVCAGTSDLLTIHCATTGEELVRKENRLCNRDRCLLFARKGQWLLTASAGVVLVLDGFTGELQQTRGVKHSSIIGMALSDDGKVLVTACDRDNDVSLWKLDEWK
jgi:WD40 repeat protein